MSSFPALMQFILLTALPGIALSESQCFGTTSNGRIEHSVRLPESGPNFVAYSSIAVAAGRTHVHSRVAAILADSYQALHAAHPELTYVYGETGWPSGGSFQPHRTHQNGLSVDFFVPVRNAGNRSVALPTSPGNRFGYDIEFDRDSRFGEYKIDYEALAEHLYQLDIAARRQGAAIALVIFDTAYLRQLFATHRGAYLKERLPFMKGKPWVRHDEHYHVDFAVPCKPASAS